MEAALTSFNTRLEEEGGQGIRMAVMGELDRATVPRFERAPRRRSSVP